jgi:hypothetical protein
MTIPRVGIAIGAALGLQAYVFYYAVHYGVLSGLLQWDDCIVILRGFKNLDLLAHSQSVLGLLHAARHFDIHAPISDVQTIVGLLLSSGQIWGPYLLNATWLALALFAILSTIDRGNRVLAASAALFILVQPVVINALTYVDSDWTGGPLLAGALVVMNAGVERNRSDWKVFAAGLLGISILSKLTAFYLPVLALGILILFESHAAMLAGLRQSGQPLFGSAATTNTEPTYKQMPNSRAFMLRATLAIGPFLLFFVYKFNSTIAYIRDAITNNKWKDGFTALERAIYYSPFSQISWQSWGKLHVFFLIFSLGAVVAAIRLRRPSYLVSLFILLAISAAFFAPLIVPHTSFISFAATFLGVIMATTIVSMDFICRSFPRWGGWGVLTVTALIALSTTLPFSNSAYFDPAVIANTAPARASIVIGEDELHQIANTYENVVQDIYDHRTPNAPNIIVFF